MSLRYEQQRALVTTREFLREILSGPRQPQKVLKEKACSCLRHFPFLDKTGKPLFSQDDFECPEIEDVTL